MRKYNVIDSIDLLKDSEVLVSFIKSEKNYFAYKNDRILVKSSQSTYRLTLEEFVELYSDQEFYLYEPQIKEEVNSEKDQEYYAWRHK